MENSKATPEVRECVTVFLDLLGYREAVAQCHTRAALNTELAKIRNAFDTAGSWLSGEGLRPQDKPIWTKRAFTDNIVIGYPTLDPNALAEPELGRIFLNLSLFQLYMIRSGYFVRGAISVGDLYMDEDIVFGPAILEAYEVESSIARDPRIVLAPSAVRFVERHLTWYHSVEDAPHDRSLLKDADGQLFLNYLDETILIAEYESGPYYEELIFHKERIVEELERHRNAPTIWAKYRWCAAYHNFFCDSHKYFAPEHRIPEENFTVVPRRLSADLT